MALCTECGFHGFRDELGRHGRGGRRAGRPWVADYPLVDTPGVVRGVPRRAEPPAAVLRRHRDHRDRPAPGRPGRAVVLLEGGRGVLPAGPRAGRVATARRGGDAGRPAADPGRPGDREGRPERQVRHAGPRRRGRRAGRADHRHDDPQLPARERRAQPQPRPALPAPARPRR